MDGMSEDERLARAIKVAQWRHHRALDRRLRAVGSSLAQWDVLRAIDTLPGASGHDLAAATFQSDQAFGTLAGRLLAQGLIARSPGEGRRMRHDLTDEGRARLAAGRAVVADVLSDAFGGLSRSERDGLAALLAKIREPGGPDPGAV